LTPAATVFDVSVTAMRISVLIHVSIDIEYGSDTRKRNRLSTYLVNSLLPPIFIPILAEKACPNFE
jgi:hypothetical protein